MGVVSLFTCMKGGEEEKTTFEVTEIASAWQNFQINGPSNYDSVAQTSNVSISKNRNVVILTTP